MPNNVPDTCIDAHTNNPKTTDYIESVPIKKLSQLLDINILTVLIDGYN